MTIHTGFSLESVPAERATREAILAAIELRWNHAGGKSPLVWTRAAIEREATAIVASLELPHEMVAWTMVAFGSWFWRDEVRRVPHSRRLLLLPHCLRSATDCPATMDADGLHCVACGRCVLTELAVLARSLGYHVLIAEGTPIVSRWIVSGKADAILGVGCLKSLERAFDKLALAGIPAMAVPLLKATCRDTTVDVDLVRAMIETPFDATLDMSARRSPPRWLAVLRMAGQLFESPTFETLLPPRRAGEPTIAVTEEIARDFVRRGGKFYRPFLTLAVADALQKIEQETETDQPPAFTVDQQRVALAMEIFHKASLVHDDIEDDDSFRYGVASLHRQHGVATAINVGDYLIGAGYRLIAEATSLAPATRSELLTILATAHTRLAEGQGADIAFRGASLSPLETLKIYSLKTSPAFEAAVLAGIALTQDAALLARLREPLSRFCRHLGIAFQIRNDLDDWREGDDNNKLISGSDAAHERPTILRALALEQTPEQVSRGTPSSDVWAQTLSLLAKYRTRAQETLADIPATETRLRTLLTHLMETLVG